MAQDELAHPPDPAIDSRQQRDRRHGPDRRSVDRATAGRRHRDRRRNKARGLLFSALSLVAPVHMRHHMSLADALPRIIAPRVGPRIDVSIESFTPVDPSHAYDDLIREAATKYKLEPALIRGVMRMESGFDPFAVSRVGAMGLMQLMPDVAEGVGED